MKYWYNVVFLFHCFLVITVINYLLFLGFRKMRNHSSNFFIMVQGGSINIYLQVQGGSINIYLQVQCGPINIYLQVQGGPINMSFKRLIVHEYCKERAMISFSYSITFWLSLYYMYKIWFYSCFNLNYRNEKVVQWWPQLKLS